MSTLSSLSKAWHPECSFSRSWFAYTDNSSCWTF